MGLLRRIGTGILDGVKGTVNTLPGIGGITKTAFGEVGSRGIVGRIGGGGGGRNSIAPNMQAPGLPFQLPENFNQSNTSNMNDPNRNLPVQSGMSGQIQQLLGSNQIIMEPELKTIHSAPPGWVIVTMPDGSKKAVLKDVARCLGLWKARKKPPITAGQWSTLKKARSVEKKAKRIAETANFVCTPRKTRR